MKLTKHKARWKMLILAVTFMAFSASAEVKYLELNCTDGSIITFALKDKPVISIDDNILLVEGGSQRAEIPLADLANYTFTENTSQIEEVKQSRDDKVLINGSEIIFSNLKASEIISIFNMEGMVIMRTYADSEGNCILDISHLSAGVYIIHTPTLSIKFQKK